MKKILLVTAIAALASGTAMAQNKNVVSANNYLNYFTKDKDPKDLLEAKTYIDQAAEHPDTKEAAKTWFYRGKIYYSILDSKDPKVNALSDRSLEESIKSFSLTIKYDPKKNYPEATDFLKRCGAIAANRGVAEFSKNDFGKALNWFEVSMGVNKDMNTLDTVLVYNAALAADKSGNYDKAIGYYNQIIDVKFGGKNGGKYYSYLANVYKNKKDDANYLATIQKGRAAFPQDGSLILDVLNYFLSAGKTKEAIDNIDLAIKNDPNNHVLHYNRGVLYDNMANPAPDKKQVTEAEYNDYFAKSEASYLKALEIKPDYFDGQYNLGALYFNKGVKVTDKANETKDQKKYDELVKSADKEFQKAIPYLEKADALKAPDKVTEKALCQTLQKLYLMTEQPEKAKAVKERLKNL